MAKKTILITGAGSGIGRATAIRLSRDENVTLLLVGRRKDALQATLSLCDRSEKHQCIDMDVREKSDWQSAKAQHQDAMQQLYAVFANAGVGGENHYGPEDRWDEIISTNLTGTYVTLMECMPYLQMKKFAHRHIVVTSSCLARFGVPRYTAYCAAKEGLLGLTKALAVEHALSGLLINAICPGWVETEMAQNGIQKLADNTGESYEKTYASQMSFVPTGKMSQPDEIAAMVEFLFSDRQVSMTGQGIDINNGSFML